MTPPVRIGIDVGGTFTHAVALDSTTLEIIGKVKVPTTHQVKQGVARGIVQSLTELMKSAGISPDSVSLIAHSTTQATNALLEGDVAAVGILGMGKGASSVLARISTGIKSIELSPRRLLETYHQFIDTARPPSEEAIAHALNSLIKMGAESIAISEAFSPDDPVNELKALEIAQSMGIPATAGSQVSQLYGLKVRTRTAVINASMLPKMIESANMTEQGVREAGIKAPIMIMRSDGGVMDIEAMRRKPILTMLSGPAAGVAAAMMYLHISDGIFMEVGGTSTDISAIHNGKAQIKSGEVGGHRVYLRTLDVRTVGIAGGSIPRMQGSRLVEVGPRSAHIAGLKYASFADAMANPQIQLIQPHPNDPKDYVALAEGDEEASVCVTPTCAANRLGLVAPDDCASGNHDSIDRALKILATRVNTSADEIARDILSLSAQKCLPTVDRFINDYKLDREMITLIGGGGGAAAIVPFMSDTMHMRHRLAENADVISAIGVALALVRETVERNIVSPSTDDILKVRSEAQAAVIRMGADPATVEVQVDIDVKSNTVRATASGATELTSDEQPIHRLSPPEELELAADSLRVPAHMVTLLLGTDHFHVYQAELTESRLFGLFKSRCHALRVLDSRGSIRLQYKNALAELTSGRHLEPTLKNLCETYARFGEAGKTIPNLVILAGARIVDLSGLLDIPQLLGLAKIELQTSPTDENLIVLVDLGAQ